MFRVFATFFEKKGGAKKLSIGKFLSLYIVRSGFVIAESELLYIEKHICDKSFFATMCHPERSRSLRVVNEQTKVRSTAGIS